MSKIHCRTCGKDFPHSGRAGHCGVCHETFIGLTAFDAHRVGPHGTPERRCELQPEESVNEKGNTVHGHWRDERGYLHHGARGYWKKDEA